MRDGSVVSYRDVDPSHVRQERFELILKSDPLSFSVTGQDGATFTVDLVSGSLWANEECFGAEHQKTPLRLIYYKHMEMSSGSETAKPEMMYYVVGWQTTTEDGRNLKIGLKIFPSRKSYEVTSDI